MLLTLRNVSGKQARWLLIPRFDFGLIHSTDIKHQSPVALSKLKTEQANETRLDDKLLVLMMNDNEE